MEIRLGSTITFNLLSLIFITVCNDFHADTEVLESTNTKSKWITSRPNIDVSLALVIFKTMSFCLRRLFEPLYYKIKSHVVGSWLAQLNSYCGILKETKALARTLDNYMTNQQKQLLN